MCPNTADHSHAQAATWVSCEPIKFKRKAPKSPIVTPQVRALDKSVAWSRALDGTEYMPGLAGLNNMKANDYANVVIQILVRVTPIR